jgi:hypothetical protein
MERLEDSTGSPRTLESLRTLGLQQMGAGATSAVRARFQVCEISLVRDLIATAPVLRFTLGRCPGRAGSSMVRAGRS